MANKKNTVGRPTLMTNETVKKLEDAFLYGATDLEACLEAGISKQTLYTYQEKNPEFVDRKELLKNQPRIKAKKVVMKSIEEGDKETSKWYLERRSKDEFSTKTESKMEVELPTPIMDVD